MGRAVAAGARPARRRRRSGDRTMVGRRRDARSLGQAGGAGAAREPDARDCVARGGPDRMGAAAASDAGVGAPLRFPFRPACDDRTDDERGGLRRDDGVRLQRRRRRMPAADSVHAQGFACNVSTREFAQERFPMAYEQILVDLKDGVATITLNRPERLNAYTATMGAELHRAFAELDQNDDARVIVVTGAGRAFCAGADLSSGGGTFDRNRPGAQQQPAREEHAIRPWNMKKPIIAAINGPAVGVGITLPMQWD